MASRACFETAAGPTRDVRRLDRRATSCTRTIAAPASIAQVAVASDASRRSSTGGQPHRLGPVRSFPGTPCGSCRPLPETRRDETRRDGGAGRGCARAVFPKPIPGSTQTSVTPAATRRRRPVDEESVHLSDDVCVARDRPAWSRVFPACAWRPSRHRTRPPRPQSARRDVVDQGGAGLDRCQRQPPAWSCRQRPGPPARAPPPPGRRAGALRPRDTGPHPGGSTPRRRRPRRRPAATSSRPCSTARSWSRKFPPSENESGVTLSTPMTRGRIAPYSRAPPEPPNRSDGYRSRRF